MLLLSQFQWIAAEELPEGMQSGWRFQTFSFDVPVYLRWLLDQFKARGGRIFYGRLGHLKDGLRLIRSGSETTAASTEIPALVVNCLGLGSRYIKGVEDRRVYPVRGQTLLVKLPTPSTGSITTNQADTLPEKMTLPTIIRVEEPPIEELTKESSMHAPVHQNAMTYLIPRQDGTILLGGTQQAYDANAEPHPEIAREILERCQRICPALRQVGDRAVVVRHGVGLRPVREGGVRLEVDSEGLGKSSLFYGYCY